MEEKKEKKGFWASLFTPKSCDCCCGTQIEEVKEEPVLQKEQVNQEEVKEDKPTCGCGENC